MLHIDQYLDKDMYRMLYFTPLEKVERKHRLILKVEKQKWNEEYERYEE